MRRRHLRERGHDGTTKSPLPLSLSSPSASMSPRRHASPLFNFIEPSLKHQHEPPFRSFLPVLPTPPTKGSASATPRGNRHDGDVRSADANQHAPCSPVDGERIVFHVLQQCAANMDDPTLDEDSKMMRLWQSLQQHSEGGRRAASRLRSSTEDNRDEHQLAFVPNPICTAMLLEIVRQLVAACGLSLVLTNLLLGGLGNAIYRHYDPDQCSSAPPSWSFGGGESHKQYADHAHALSQELAIARHELAASHEREILLQAQVAVWSSVDAGTACDVNEGEDDGKDEAEGEDTSPSAKTTCKSALATALFRCVKPVERRASAIITATKPFLDRELLLQFWRATAHVLTPTSVSATNTNKCDTRREFDRGSVTNNSDMDEDTHGDGDGDVKDIDDDPVGARHQRVQLVLAMCQTLGLDEQRLIGTDMLQTLEKRRRRGTTQMPPPALQIPPTPTTPMSTTTASSSFRGRSRTRLSTYWGTSVPQSPTSMDQSEEVERLTRVQGQILHLCEDIFDILCSGTPAPRLTSSAHSERRRSQEGDTDTLLENDTSDQDVDEDMDSDDEEETVAMMAARQLRDLLCAYVATPSRILAKYEDARDARRLEQQEREQHGGTTTAAFVKMLITQQTRDPMVLVHAVTQRPQLLLSAVERHPGLLRFAIVKHAALVERFLRLDGAASDHLHALARQHHGAHLLWSSDATTTSMVTAASSQDTHLQTWLTAHTDELATLVLQKPELLAALLRHANEQGGVAAFYQLMQAVAATSGVDAFMRRASVAALERVAQLDPGELVRVLRDVLASPLASQEADSSETPLMHQLRMSPTLATCLGAFHDSALQTVIARDVDAWRPMLVDAAMGDDDVLRACLHARTATLDGADMLVTVLNAVLDGTTAGLTLHILDGSTATDHVDGSTAMRVRKMRQCVHLRGGSTVFRTLLAPLLAGSDWTPLPHELMMDQFHTPQSTANKNHAARKTSRYRRDRHHHRAPLNHRQAIGGASPVPPSMSSTPSRSRKAAPLAPPATSASGSQMGALTRKPLVSRTAHGKPSDCDDQRELQALPILWQRFLNSFLRSSSRVVPTTRAGERAALSGAEIQPSSYPEGTEPELAPLTRAHVKTLVLDIWLEFLKVDVLQLDNASLWALTPFVCEYFLLRYEAPGIAAQWLTLFADGLRTYQEDPRIAFFAAACGVTTLAATVGSSTEILVMARGYDTFLYYAHALEHLFFEHVRVFKPGNRLDETSDGSCLIERRHAVAVARQIFDYPLVGSDELDALTDRLEALPMIESWPAPPPDSVELDNIMSIFLDQWHRMHRNSDELYTRAFADYDAGNGRIGREQFIQIVTHVTQQRVSRRECMLVYCHAGHEFMDLPLLLRITHSYHLRSFHAHLAELELTEDDRHELELTVGRSNVYSVAREVEDLMRYWRGISVEIQEQMTAAHQKEATKVGLRKRSVAIERILADVQATLHRRPAVHARARLQPSSEAAAALTPELLGRAWHEIRACAKLLHTAKLTQQYLSRLFIQSSLVRWIRQAQRRTVSAGGSMAPSYVEGEFDGDGDGISDGDGDGEVDAADAGEEGDEEDAVAQNAEAEVNTEEVETESDPDSDHI